MSAVRVLGKIGIPAQLTQNLAAIRLARSDDFAARGVIEVHYYAENNPKLPSSDAWQLDADKTGFGQALLTRLGLSHNYMHDAALMGYANLAPHIDEGFWVDGEYVAFLHVVLSGSGTLRIPDSRSPAERVTSLSAGLVFVLNPEHEHAFDDCPDMLFSLSMVVPKSAMEKLPLL
ncbi:MAG TPA: hypothetical protein VLC92_14705 [Rhodocyclaceae bacterium]|nr:hypothetical protein [Rhodocyclaceae bacterium]